MCSGEGGALALVSRTSDELDEEERKVNDQENSYALHARQTHDEGGMYKGRRFASYKKNGSCEIV